MRLHATDALRLGQDLPVAIGGWMDPRAGQDNIVREMFLTLPEPELRPFGRAARTPTPFRLR